MFNKNTKVSSAGLCKSKEVQAQGTIEYLIIVAIVIVIALIVVGILLQLMGQGSGVNETSSKIAWQSAQPWGIIEWNVDTDGNLQLILQNNSAYTMDLVKVSVGQGTDWNTGLTGIPANSTQSVTIVSTGVSSGNQYSFAKGSIYIDYNTPNITEKRQSGVADIVGTAAQ
jgi:hypothetical protein